MHAYESLSLLSFIQELEGSESNMFYLYIIQKAESFSFWWKIFFIFFGPMIFLPFFLAHFF